MTIVTTYIILLLAAIWTVVYLPFINIESALRIQDLLQRIKEWAERHDK